MSVMQWWTTDGLPGLHGALRAVLPFQWAQYGFMLNALIECLLLAPLCAAMGVQLVNFRLAFFSDAVSHSAFTGVAVGFLLQEWASGWGGSFDPQVTLIGFGLLVAFGVAMVRRRTNLATDTIVGVFFSAVVALGLAIVTASGARTSAFQKYLYGDILTLDAADLVWSAVLTLVVGVAMTWCFTPMTLIGLNPELAHSRGLRVRFHDYLFSLLLALVVTVTIRTAGILLVTGMLLVPAATARNIARTAGGMFRWTILIAWVCSVGGTMVSFSTWLENVSTGAVIVLLATLCFAISLFFRRSA
ncbi:MAG: metal ABC transporter permease [Planctomycetota bacterium]